MYEVMDETAAQVLLTLEPGDSIRRVARRIQRPYETVRQTVDRLEDAGFTRYDEGLYVREDRVRDAALEVLGASARVSPPTVEEAYVLPHFSEHRFAFSRIDAVYVWTRGGYQVARDPDDYPLFVAVRETEVPAWEEFFSSFGLPTALDRQPRESVSGPVQIVLDPRTELEADDVEGYPVVSRDETIDYMYEHYAQFQSALSMLDRTYDDLDLDEPYREHERSGA